MTKAEIKPHLITKPIQLLAAWLAGLAIVNATFLTAAAQISVPTWGPGLLVVAAVVNVPLFILSLFLLQTKFRPEMQEDSYYSEYLQNKTSDAEKTARSQKPTKREAPEIRLHKLAADIVANVSSDKNHDKPKRQEKVEQLLKKSEIDRLVDRFADNRTISELYMYPNLWRELVDQWGKDVIFKRDLKELVDYGLIAGALKDPNDAKLTDIGLEVAKGLEQKSVLWNQNHERHI